MELNVAVHDAAQRAHKFVNLQRIRDANGIRDAHPVDANYVNGTVDGQQVDQIAAKAVLAAEPHFQPATLDVFNDFLSRLDYVLDVLSVRELTQIAARSKHYVDAVDAGVYRHACIIHVTAHVGQISWRSDLGW